MFGLELTTIVQFLGYPGLAGVIFLESGVFFGFFLPGASLLFVAGMLASLDFFERYGKASVLLARFVPIARTFVPILAGVGAMDYRVFLFYNVVGAVVWAGGFTLLGYFIGP